MLPKVPQEMKNIHQRLIDMNKTREAGEVVLWDN